MKPFYNFLILISLAINVSATELDISKMRDSKTIMDKVNKGFDVNAVRAEDGYTLLHYAAEMGDDKLVKFLISKGSEINPIMTRGNTPLSTAIAFRKKEAVRALLEAGVDPNYILGQDDYIRSHFHFYINKERKIDKAIFDLFISKGANLETRDFFDETPLITAAGLEYSMTDNAKYLLKAGADIQAENKHGKTALMTAVFSQNMELIKTLLKAGAPVDQKAKDGNTALVAMIGMGQEREKEKIAIMKILLDAGANINEPNKEGDTALHECIKSKWYVEMLKFLVSKNPDSSIKNAKGKTALDQAIINENMEATKILLKIEKDINRLDSYGSTMLHSAILNEKYELVKLLLEAGADKAAKDKWGKSAVEFAERQGNQRMIELLR